MAHDRRRASERLVPVLEASSGAGGLGGRPPDLCHKARRPPVYTTRQEDGPAHRPPDVLQLSKNPAASGAYTRRPGGGLSSLRTAPRERWIARRLSRAPQRVFCLPGARFIIPTADAAEWKAWIAEAYGSTADAPIERGEQGSYEVREPFE
jgi:hypothetical protein